ncbi:MAG TPA: ribosome maturation factor RimP [Steroidobacteraceae bacterium]|jgi:ribosome maturation factor RimP|nr:ribosome maturation factor RimP [Steroidobacteraceae bacterium]
MRDALMRLLEPPIEALGFELVELEFAQAGRGATLRIYIDRLGDHERVGDDGDEVRIQDLRIEDSQIQDSPTQASPSQGGISVDDCAAVSHVVSRILDAEDPIKGHYTLEVSSPGVDRVLRKRVHFERFVGERVFVELKLPIEGRRRFAGTLKSVLGEAIVVEVDGRAHELPLERIQKARLRPE